MPDRFLREGFLRSSKLQDLECEVRDFYVRLLLLVDDFGCFDGRGPIVVTQAYPTRYADEFPDVEAMLCELHAAGLIVRYSNAGKPYIALTQWRCGIRSRRRFPAPPVDVDLYDSSEAALRGPYGREIIWNNPPGSERTSILLDFDGRAAVPQPPEWRPASHFIPVTQKRKDHRPVTVDQPLEKPASDCAPVIVDPQLVLPTHLVTQKVVQEPSQEVLPSVTADQSLTAPAAAINGHIKFENGAWSGIEEGQRLRWQEAFEDVAVPVQLDRMAAWLAANPAEASANARHGWEQFIVRWLLRESRAKPGPEPLKH